MSKARTLARRPNAPPEDENWTWWTRQRLESLAWRAMPLCARQVVDRIQIELLNHGGRDNGRLPVTYDDFEKYGVRKGSIRRAVDIAIALGFVDRTERGVRAHGAARRPAKYGLTWIPRVDGTFASNRWMFLKTDDDVKQALANVKCLDRGKVRKPTRPPLTWSAPQLIEIKVSATA